jgi:hypothetical protein
MTITRDIFRMSGGMPVVTPPAPIDTTTLTGANTVSAAAVSADQ